MKKVEISNIRAKSVFKVTLYLMLLPSVLFLIIGLVALAFGLVTGEEEAVIMGAFIAFGYPILFMGVYGGMSMLIAVIYNKLAGKFGGLEMHIKDIEM